MLLIGIATPPRLSNPLGLCSLLQDKSRKSWGQHPTFPFSLAKRDLRICGDQLYRQNCVLWASPDTKILGVSVQKGSVNVILTGLSFKGCFLCRENPKEKYRSCRFFPAATHTSAQRRRRRRRENPNHSPGVGGSSLPRSCPQKPVQHVSQGVKGRRS